MSEQGAAMQMYNQELVKGIEDMKKKHSELQQLIDEQEGERIAIQREIENLSYRLTQINDNLSKKIAARNEYDHTIAEAESAYSKIIESSQVLLNMVRREASCLEQTMAKKMTTDSYHTLSMSGTDK